VQNPRATRYLIEEEDDMESKVALSHLTRCISTFLRSASAAMAGTRRGRPCDLMHALIHLSTVFRLYPS
jgi:hypothetical protein